MQPTEILQRLIWGLLTAIVLSWIWLIWRVLSRQPILPERTLPARRAVPWRLGTILAVFLLYIAVSLVVSASHHLVASLLPAKPQHVPWFDLMLLNGLVMAILPILVPWVVRTTSRAQPSDFGLSLEDWWPQAVHGVIATLIAAPPVYAIQFGAAMIWKPSQHPLVKMIEEEFSVGVGWLAVVTAVMLAPMFEELVFRGLVQSWLVGLFNGRSRSSKVPSLADTPPLAATEQELAIDVWETKPEMLSVADSQTTESPGQLESTDRAWLGIALTSLLFAYVHAPQWPAPIALFVLALAIGTVFNHTGSLITAVFMHATFNGITTLMLFITALSGQKLEPDKVTGRARGELRLSVEVGKDLLAVAIGSDCALQKVKSVRFFLDGRESDC